MFVCVYCVCFLNNNNVIVILNFYINILAAEFCGSDPYKKEIVFKYLKDYLNRKCWKCNQIGLGIWFRNLNQPTMAKLVFQQWKTSFNGKETFLLTVLVQKSFFQLKFNHLQPKAKLSSCVWEAAENIFKFRLNLSIVFIRRFTHGA